MTQIVTVSLTEENGQLKAGTPELFSPTEFNESAPEFSPDGKWIAFVTDRSGRNEVVVRAFPPSSNGPGAEAVLSNNGGTEPRWSQRGRELLYLEGNRLMSVAYRTIADTFMADKPRVRLEKSGWEWDLAADGRILMVDSAQGQAGDLVAPEHHVVFVEHFIDEVKRRVK
jgi:serine/threonine-protein kinase